MANLVAPTVFSIDKFDIFLRSIVLELHPLHDIGSISFIAHL